MTEAKLAHLVWGFWHFPTDEGLPTDPWFPFESEEHRREVYLKHRREVLAACDPGLRPAAWWDYSAPEPRRVLRGDPKTPDATRLWMGKPRLLGGNALFEPTWALLERCGLLTPEEEELLPKWRAELDQDLCEWAEDEALWEELKAARRCPQPGETAVRGVGDE